MVIGSMDAADLPETAYFPFAMFFAPVTALALFGYLSDHTECCAVHALPIRRERLFVIRLLAAFAMYAVPMAVYLFATRNAVQDDPLKCFGWSCLEFLFLFSMAVLCMFITGRKVGAAILYMFLQMLPVLTAMALVTMYQPQLPGVYLDLLAFTESPSIYVYELYLLSTEPIPPEYTGLFIRMILVVLAVSAVFYALSLLLYRRRKLEYAGDLLAVRWLHPVFAFCSAMVGGCVIESMFSASDEVFSTPFFLLGLAIGYGFYWMLAKKSARIFTPKLIAGFAAIAAVTLGSVGLTAMDPLGRVGYIPQADAVKTATFSTSVWDPDVYRTDDPEMIASIGALHLELLTEHLAAPYFNDYPDTIHITYELESGRTIRREYAVRSEELKDKSAWYLSQPVARLHTEEPVIDSVTVSCDGKSPYKQTFYAQELFELVLTECSQGRMYVFEWEDKSDWNLIINLSNGSSIHIDVPKKAVDLIDWLNKNGNFNP
jgi:ABC-2 type transport system permease protein